MNACSPRRVVCYAFLVGVTSTCLRAAPLGSTFTYHGFLEVPAPGAPGSWVPADTAHDFRFELYNVSAGGAAMATINREEIEVDRGVFQVDLDFGATSFADVALFLEVAVRPATSTGAFTIVGRQPIRATPFSITSLKDAYWALNGPNLSNSHGDRVGINEADPMTRLHVTGTVSNGANFTDTQLMFEDAVIEGQEAWLGLYSGVAGPIGSGLLLGTFDPNAITTQRWAVFQNNDSIGGHLIIAEGTDKDPRNLDSVMRFETNGRVGIGLDSAPETRLDILGSTAALPGTPSPVLRVRTEFATPGSNQDVVDIGQTSINGYTYDSGNLSDKLLELNDNSSGDVLVATGGGDVGIGTAAPDAKLEVETDSGSLTVPTALRSTSKYRNAVGETNTSFIDFVGTQIRAVFNTTYSTLWLQPLGGNVAIGTTTPANARLHVTTTPAGIGPSFLSGEDVLIEDAGAAWLGLYGDDQPSTGIASGIVFGEKSGQPNGDRKWAIYKRVTANEGDLVITFGPNANPGSNEKVAQFLPDGTTKVQVLEITGGADIAERFPCSEAVEPGTVMELDPENQGQLRVSRTSYNKRVAGIVSGAGGLPAGAILGNLPGQDKQPAIAMSGRVYVQCDARTDAIAVGDLLTTSNVPGHAMRATDLGRTTGALIGKAMTELRQGETGLVLVLVGLQ